MIDGEQQDDEVLELTPEDEVEEQAEQAVADDDDNDVSIEIEGDEEPEDTPVIKKLRGEIRDRDKRLAALEAAHKPKPTEVGKEPDLWEDCEGDPDRYKTALLAWNEQRFAADRAEMEARKREEAARAQHQDRIVAYKAKAAQLGIKDFKEAEDLVIQTLPETLQNAILLYADDPAKVVAALGKSPARLQALASEQDPIRFILAMRDMEKGIKVVNRKKAPAPETIVRGSAPVAQQSTDKKLAELEKEADRTGDRTKLIHYKMALKEKAK